MVISNNHAIFALPFVILSILFIRLFYLKHKGKHIMKEMFIIYDYF